MIRAHDSAGVLILGITREALMRALDSEDEFLVSVQQDEDDAPVEIHIYCAETDDACIAKMSRGYKRIDEVRDYRGRS